MHTIEIAKTGRSTTCLGFGCSSVMGALNRKESLAMLEAAVEAGITHFDVAPAYGYGEAESCLGELFSRHPGRLTVTTKYGIAPPKAQSFLGVARSLVKPLIRHIPGLKERLAGVAGKVVPKAEAASFTPDEARISLETSLRELKVDHLDLWLLHEATAADLHDERLLRLLEDTVTQGKIGCFGVGSEAAKIPSLLTERPAYCRTLQYEWSIFDPTIDYPAIDYPAIDHPSTDDGAISGSAAAGRSFRVHHRALTDHFRSLHAALTAHSELCRQWSQETGQDLARSETLANLMLKGSLVANPASIILFSSKSPSHIRANVAVAEDNGLEAAARALHKLVLANRVGLLPNLAA